VTALLRRDANGHRLARSGAISRHAITNLAAQAGALGAVSVASLMIARAGGPTVVGEYALVRVLPWLLGVLLSCGLPTASAFFLAGKDARDPRLRPTLALMTVAGALVATGAWLACAALFQQLFFRQMPLQLVVLAGVMVVTQLGTVTAKGCCQGTSDITGANLIIVFEELWFVFVYPAVLLVQGNQGISTVILALIISGSLAMLTGMTRLWKRQFFAGWGRPSAGLTKRIAAFGARGQLGNMLWLMNLRFDFVLLGALAGPAVLGIYAVASKFAELMRLVPTALNYVLYPRFARLGPDKATAEARRLLPRAAALTTAMAPVLAAATYFALPILYGAAFAGAVLPAEVIIIGLTVEGAAAVSSAYLLGSGRPGLNSVGMGVGATITVALDIILIPRLGAMGGAITSAITYLASTMTLTLLAILVSRRVSPHGGRQEIRAVPGHRGPPTEELRQALGRYRELLAEMLGDPAWALACPAAAVPAIGSQVRPGSRRAQRMARSDSITRRATDIAISLSALLFASPLLLGAAVMVKLTSRGPVFYRQIRVGHLGRHFRMFKFRSMVSGADRAGPLITDRGDPRVTRVGALLRASKIDELPQLLNVMRGEMTLIGPRPEVPRFLPCYRPDELGVLRVRPGLTGPGQLFYTEAQAAGEAADDPERHYVEYQLHPKLEIDLDYLRRRCLRADLAIVVRTVAVISHLARPAQLTVVTPDAGQP
jgi:lipopolysaccharide/colanic/teichoic acid biosynthesis glycosyltransferase/O-antigen/teichoic acid export membrane protein